MLGLLCTAVSATRHFVIRNVWNVWATYGNWPTGSNYSVDLGSYRGVTSRKSGQALLRRGAEALRNSQAWHWKQVLTASKESCLHFLRVPHHKLGDLKVTGIHCLLGWRWGVQNQGQSKAMLSVNPLVDLCLVLASCGLLNIFVSFRRQLPDTIPFLHHHLLSSCVYWKLGF